MFVFFLIVKEKVKAASISNGFKSHGRSHATGAPPSSGLEDVNYGNGDMDYGTWGREVPVKCLK